MFVFMFVAASIFDTMVAADVKYEFVNCIEGEITDLHWTEVGIRQILATICSGELYFPRDYACENPLTGDEQVPDCLRLEVQESGEGAPPLVMIAQDGESVSIYRDRNSCHQRAIIRIFTACNVFEEDAEEYDDEEE